MSDTIEFYDRKRMVSSVLSSMVPPVGSIINISKNNWEVVSVTYALDYSYRLMRERKIRANVDLKKI